MIEQKMMKETFEKAMKEFSKDYESDLWLAYEEPNVEKEGEYKELPMKMPGGKK